MANTIVLPKNFDVNELTFDSVKKNSMGGNVVYFKYENHPKIIMQTPAVSAPFGLSTYTDDKTGAVKYSIDISFRGMEEDPKIQLFHDQMSAFDDFLMNAAVTNSKDWFGKKQSKEVVENFYRPLVKPSKDPTKYAPTMKFKIMTKRDGTIDVDTYDGQKQKVNLQDVLTSGAKVQAIIEAGSVWFVNKTMFGISWKLVQVKILPSDKIAGFSFQEDSDEEEEEEEVVVGEEEYEA
tara:strand:- start:9535 stop:10242 length:708 start_codon:yes stop_codon:yes gene_type:complete